MPKNKDKSKDLTKTAEILAEYLKDDEEKYKVPCPELKANFLSRIFFCWVGSLLKAGHSHPIQPTDLWELRPQDTSKFLIDKYLKNYDCSKEEIIYSDDRSFQQRGIFDNFGKPLIKSFWKPYLLMAALKQISDLLSFVLPLILSVIIQFMEDEDSTGWNGYYYALAILFTSILKTIIHHQHMELKYSIAYRMRSALINAVYRKSLKLSSSPKNNITSGEVVNHINVDVVRVMDIVHFSGDIWGSPIQIAVASYLLYRQLGAAILIGLIVFVFLIPLNILLTRRMHNYQSGKLKRKDARVKMMNEILSGMKILKLYAWELPFQETVNFIRSQEMSFLKKKIFLSSFVIFLWGISPFLISLTCFSIFIFTDEKSVMTAERAFVSLSLFNLLNQPATNIPNLISKFAESRVSLRRLNKFFNAEEKDCCAVTLNERSNGKFSIVVNNASFSWDSSENVVLNDIALKIKKGSLVSVVGSVGSGKSSLISSLLGETKKLCGEVSVFGSIAFVSQLPWIQNISLHDNILFGLPQNPTRYKNVLESCALNPDLKVLPNGDQTEIGEKGINLSGGQKQRVALARAAFCDADVYLLDDPLSSVDSHVGKHIFENLLSSTTGLLKTKTRVLVTHGVTHLPKVDQIIVIENGRISEVGSYKHLMAQKGAFANFLIQYIGENPSTPEDENIIQDLEFAIGKERVQVARLSSVPSFENISSRGSFPSISVSGLSSTNQEFLSTVKLVEDEKAETGNIKLSVFQKYISAIGWMIFLTVIMMHIAHQGKNYIVWTITVVSVGANYSLSVWAAIPTINGTQDINKKIYYLSIYAILGFSQCILIMLITIVLSLALLRASRILHDNMLCRIMKAPMSFFDCNPLGRIINRFSADVQTLDQALPATILDLIESFFRIMSSFMVNSTATPYFMIIAILNSFIYILIQRYYVATSRQLSRLESISRSPIYSHFTESLNGVRIIRAYRAQDRFITECEKRVDGLFKILFPANLIRRWLSVRLELLGSIIVYCATLFAIIARKNLSASLAGLSISYTFHISSKLTNFTFASSNLEIDIVSAERVFDYSEITQEAEWENNKIKLSDLWPEQGHIIYNKYKTRYREGLDLVLNDITCEIEPGQKIGIVGRTGAGKSSVTLGLFRIVEAVSGSIVIDGLDISTLGLHDIRKRLTIIPQDPVLFSGTLRFNLDPLACFSDEQIWLALEHAHMKDFVNGLPERLSFEIFECGRNLSIGQRQLVCLARAILRKTKIVVLDEATASIDLFTDELIQQTIRREFRDSTILTIAHRLNTIMDSTKIMVLDGGTIAELGTPAALLQNHNSIFYSLAKDAGIVTDTLF